MAGTVGSLFGLFRADEIVQNKNLRTLRSSTLSVISKQTRDILARTDLSEEEKGSQIKNLRTIENSLKDDMRVKEKIGPRLKRDLEAGPVAPKVCFFRGGILTPIFSVSYTHLTLPTN